MKHSNTLFSFFPYAQTSAPCVVTIGNFDGCHLGHQRLIENAQKQAHMHSCSQIILTFHPRPQPYLQKQNHTHELLPCELKTRAFQELGVSQHYVLNFNDELQNMTHSDFYSRFLKDFLKVRAITVGEDFHFGFQRKGTAVWLKEEAQKDKIDVDIIPSLTLNNERISSTRIRKLIGNGDLASANTLLGHPYSLHGTVLKGHQVGRQLGFPTLNLQTHEQLIPIDGVYCGYVWIEGISPDKEAPIVHVDNKKLLRAVFSIGVRPTFKTETLCIEAHILDPWDSKHEHYNLKASFYFEQKIRGMIAFRNIEDLKQQIAKDVQNAKTLL